MKSREIIILLLINLIVILSHSLSYSQCPKWIYSANQGSSSDEESTTLIPDNEGNKYLSGHFKSSSIYIGSKSLTNTSSSGSYDAFLAKYDENNIVVWATNFGGSGTEWIYKIALDKVGNVYAAGRFSSSSFTIGSTTVTNSGGDDVFLVKFDTSGSFKWIKTFGGTSNDNCLDVTTDRLNNVFITGIFNSSSISFDNYTLNNSGNKDIFLTKINSSGQVVWAKKAGGNAADHSNQIRCDQSLNVYISGYISSTAYFDNKTITTNGATDFFVAKYNAYGQIIWVKSGGGSGSEDAYSMTLNSKGYPIISGKYSSSSISIGNTTLTNTNSNRYDIFVAELDNFGNFVWAKSFGGSGDEKEWQGLATDPLDNIYVFGQFNSSSFSFGNYTLSRLSDYDLFLVKYTKTGVPLWGKSANGNGTETGRSIIIDDDGTIYVTGITSSSSLQFDNTSIGSNGGNDGFWAVMVNNIEIETTKKDVCFNDSNGFIDLSVYGGIRPYTYNWSTGDSTEDIDSLTDGLYYLTITDNGLCSYQDTFEILQNSQIIIQKTITNTCNDTNTGIVELAVSGGKAPYTFNWSNGLHTKKISNLPSDTFYVTIIDNLGCLNSDTSIVSSFPSLLFSGVTKDPSCFGITDGKIILQFSDSFYKKINWSNGLHSSWINNIPAGNYRVIVNDSFGCQYEDSFSLQDPDKIQTYFNSKNVSCFNGKDGKIELNTINGNPPFSFNWSNNEKTKDINNLSKGWYKVTITDSTNCTVSDSIELLEPLAITINSTLTNPLCFNDSTGIIEVSANGGTPPYIYQWNNLHDSGKVQSHLKAGIYYITIVDSNNCKMQDSFIITQPTEITGKFKSIPPVCHDDSTAVIFFEASGGTLPYQYIWDNKDTLFQLSKLPPVQRVTTVKIIDHNHCEYSFTDSVDIYNPNQMEINIDVISDTNNKCMGEATANVKYGTKPYQFLWNDPYKQITQTAVNLCPGNYIVQVIDDNGCKNNDTTFVYNISSIDPENKVSWKVIPNPSMDGIFRVKVDPSIHNYFPTITIYKASGKIVYSGKLAKRDINNLYFNIGPFESGIYYLVILNNTNTKIVKLISLK